MSTYDFAAPLLGKATDSVRFTDDEWRLAVGRTARRCYRWGVKIVRVMLFAIAASIVFFLFGPEIVISDSSYPATYNRLVQWRPYCKSPPDRSTALHYAYRDIPKTPALTFPSWGTYEPISPLGPDDPAWPYPTREPPQVRDAGDMEPVGVFVAILCMAKEVERRAMIRRSYESMRLQGDREGMAAVRVKFFSGRPRNAAEEEEVKAEMEAYDDLIILPITENLNQGKTFSVFERAAKNARVPSCTFKRTSNSGWSAECAGERAPDYVFKADMDTFLVLPELERRMRIMPRSKLYWGRMKPGYSGWMVKGDNMAGAGYGLSFDLVQYIAESPFVRSHLRGQEDQRVGDWLRAHPEANRVVWLTEECWMYDHPKAAQPWTHGFIFPDTIRALNQDTAQDLTPPWVSGEELERWSTTSPSHASYAPVTTNLTHDQSAESLVEGSKLSLLHAHNLQDPLNDDERSRRIAEAWAGRPTREDRMAGWETGSTIWVHSVKKDEWWRDAEAVLLGN